MKNEKYTVFGLKENTPNWAEVLLCDTENKDLFNKVLEVAPKRGYKITRVYKPNTVLNTPNFVKGINI